MADREHTQKAAWREMRLSDLPIVNRIADRVHVDYPEDEVVFSERLKLYPTGCFVLEAENQVLGYLISHPWYWKNIPALNSLLSAIPTDPSTYYLHDIALLPEIRKSGAAARIITKLIEIVSKLGFKNISLVAVNNSTEFWLKVGFRDSADQTLVPKLQSYGGNAQFMVLEL